MRDLYDLAKTKYSRIEPQFSISFYEIYGGRLLDLLNNKKQLTVLEDRNSKIQIKGLEEVDVASEEELN